MRKYETIKRYSFFKISKPEVKCNLKLDKNADISKMTIVISNFY